MTIREEFAAELKSAMLARDARRRDVVRQIETEVSLVRSSAGFKGAVDDGLYLSVIASYVKKMQKSVEEYRSLGERGEAMAEKLEWEVEFLSRWLPAKLGEEETLALVRAAILELGVGGDPKAVGRVTGHLMKDHKDVLDGALVSRLVRGELENA